ncbi:FUSC family protein [Microbacterium sp. M28]|uniref:FUSC family protein n=1 Tax=Microbacterium sp. M28 TaxID=2962064 RepID=UPI0021F48A1D|nr:FUSC family protein [Microbacterium sp. M28]UYO97082.1 FUSC family protein [Microbacterium sp. M28]
MHPPTGLTWQWSRFALGVVFALPGILVAPFSPTAGLALAIGVLPAAAFGLPSRRSRRAILPIVGVLSALGLLLGSVLTGVPPVAVASLLVMSIAASLSTRWGRVGQLLLVLVLPLVGIGLSFPDLPTTTVMAGCIVVGSVYAWLVSLLWPERDEPLPPSPPITRGADLVGYGILLGLASGIAASLGYLLDVEHVGWATATVLLVMRPARGQVILRSAGRSASVFLGAMAAVVFALFEPGGVLTGLLIALAIGAMSAMQQSRWYVAPAFTTLVALTLILSTSEQAPGVRFVERTVETLVGAGLALIFGAAIPSLYAVLRAQLSR